MKSWCYAQQRVSISLCIYIKGPRGGRLVNGIVLKKNREKKYNNMMTNELMERRNKVAEKAKYPLPHPQNREVPTNASDVLSSTEDHRRQVGEINLNGKRLLAAALLP